MSDLTSNPWLLRDMAARLSAGPCGIETRHTAAAALREYAELLEAKPIDDSQLPCLKCGKTGLHEHPPEALRLPFGMSVPAPGTKCDHGVLLEDECEACNSSTKAASNEPSEDARDAARYRWLKANHLQTSPDSWIRTGEDLEEAIDEAMRPVTKSGEA